MRTKEKKLDSLSKPDRSYLLVAVFLEEIEGKLILVVDDPNEEEAITLHVLQGQVRDLYIIHGRVGNGHATSWVRRRQLPGRVHADYVKEAPSVLHLLLPKVLEVVLHDVSENRHAPELLLVDVRIGSLQGARILLQLEVRIKLEVVEELLVFLSIRVFLHQELLLKLDDVPTHFCEHALDAVFVIRKIVNEDGLLLLVSFKVSLIDLGAMASGDCLLICLRLFLSLSLCFSIVDILWLEVVKWSFLRFVSCLNYFSRLTILSVLDDSATTTAHWHTVLIAVITGLLYLHPGSILSLNLHLLRQELAACWILHHLLIVKSDLFVLES